MEKREKGLSKKKFDMNSKEFHRGIFKYENELDKFFESNPEAEGFQIFDFFRNLVLKK